MEKKNVLRRLGLFDASVPRYTSYPPANHFGLDVGRRNQKDWLQAIPDGSAVSVYIHIPFCRRLCWFCACRTQGTKTLTPVENYVNVLLQEIAATRAALPGGVKMSRLHFGGGTPTLLPAATMDRLLGKVLDAFPPADDWEFSIEIDPTEAADDLLVSLAAHGLNRASIGVQDFAPEVQDAIGRHQTVAQTRRVSDRLKELDVANVNFDLLYGLPFQTHDSFDETLHNIMNLEPTRLAIYGYAHVPWMSKRQIMIPESELPNTEMRYDMAEQARVAFTKAGFVPVGIDHFALPGDGLAVAQSERRLKRNFQGYTDDPAETLIGLGASSISRFREGYCQNAVATSAYLDRVGNDGLSGHKGFEMSPTDLLHAQMIEELMCTFKLDPNALIAEFPDQESNIREAITGLRRKFHTICAPGLPVFEIADGYQALVRIIASSIDGYMTDEIAHSTAI